MTAFTLKEAKEFDIPVIISLQEKIWFSTYQKILSKAQMDYMFQEIYSPNALERQMQEGHKFSILYHNDLPIGFFAISLHVASSFKLHKIYLLPAAQGIGAGKQMLREAEKYVISQKGTTLIINVNRYNKAKLFYEKMGYQVIEEIDIPFGPYWMNDYVLSKTLM
tara:strand:+ start:1810 stop:2304 length:495 start_codon:yes stop_codon:yes gene_type:complete